MPQPLAVPVQRVACVLIPDFPVAVERLDQPDLAGRPVAIGGAPEERKAVLACSAEARARGVQIGMPLRSALARCPEAVLLEARHARYQEIATTLNLALAQLSPLIEPVAPGETFVGLDGLLALYGTEENLARQLAGGDRLPLPLQVGIAGGKFIARVAALLAKPGVPRRVETDAGRAFLAKLPVTALRGPVSEPVIQRLGVFGLRRLGDLAALPLSALQAQFGPEGRRAWELAQGIDTDLLLPQAFPVVLEDVFRFEQPVTTSEVIHLATRHLLQRLVSSPLFGYRAARGLSFRALLSDGQTWERSLTFRAALRDADRMLTALQGKLAAMTLSAPVEEIRLRLTDLCAESGYQDRLPIAERLAQVTHLREAVGQLKAHYGYNPLARVVEVEPWSRLPERRRALMEYEP